MRIKYFACSCRGDDEASESLNQLLNNHKIVSIEKHFVQDGPTSYWALCVTYIEQNADSRPGQIKRGKIDYRELLPDNEFAVFAKLRNLRKMLADREGVPAYALFTNEQLAAMVQRRVSTPKALREIEGVGDARAQKYGDEFIAILRAGLPSLIASSERKDANAT
jgi:superfamily II DNA helicase RecQ